MIHTNLNTSLTLSLLVCREPPLVDDLAFLPISLICLSLGSYFQCTSNFSQSSDRNQLGFLLSLRALLNKLARVCVAFLGKFAQILASCSGRQAHFFYNQRIIFSINKYY